MIKSPVVNGSEFNGVPLLPYDGPNSGYYAKILNIVKERLDDSFGRTSKVLIVRMVFKLPSTIGDCSDNDCFQYFIEEYRRAIGAKLLHYVWVREQNTSESPHWHVICYYDGNRMRYFNNMYQVDSIWAKAIDQVYQMPYVTHGFIHMCGAGINGINMNHGILVHRNNHAVIDETLKLCSYICKINTKGSAPKHVNEYGCSQIQHSTTKRITIL